MMDPFSAAVGKTQPLRLSDLFLPYAPMKNPHLKVACEEAKQWAREAKILSPRHEPVFDEFSDLAARFYPNATKDGLVLGIFLVSWLFFLDDSYDRDEAFAGDVVKVRRLMETCLETLFTGVLPTHPEPLHHFSRLFRAHLQPVADRAWLARFRVAVSDYLMRGSLKVVEGWARETTLDIDTYMERRIQDSGVLPCIDLVEAIEEAPLSDAVFASPQLQELRKLTARVIAHSNDLVSYQQEVMMRGKPNNLLRLVMQHQRKMFRDAVTEVVGMVNADVCRFEVLVSLLPKLDADAERALQKYVLGMRNQMRGNLDWSLTSVRYAAPDSPFLELRR